MKPCPNCGKYVPNETLYCSYCGHGMTAPKTGKCITNSPVGDTILGAVGSLLLFGLFGIGFIIIPICWLLMRDSYPSLSRGMGISLAICGALILGALALCLGAVGFYSMNSK